MSAWRVAYRELTTGPYKTYDPLLLERAALLSPAIRIKTLRAWHVLFRAARSVLLDGPIAQADISNKHQSIPHPEAASVEDYVVRRTFIESLLSSLPRMERDAIIHVYNLDLLLELEVMDEAALQEKIGSDLVSYVEQTVLPKLHKAAGETNDTM